MDQMPESEILTKEEIKIICEAHGGEMIDPLLPPILLGLSLFENFYKSLGCLKCDLWTRSEVPCKPKIVN